MNICAQDKTAIATQIGSGTGNGSGQGTGTVVTQTKVGAMGGVIGSIISTGRGFSGVRGVPFSADVVDESDQQLADGNHIHQETHGKIFRDSEGRTRNESELHALGMERPYVSIHIMDPVGKTMILLNPEQKTATIHHFGESMKASEMHPAEGAASTRTGADASEAGQSGGLIGNLHGMQHSQEDLGTMEIEGFTAHGTRTSFTTPAGAVGNDKPMTHSNERWYSEDLKIDLLMKSESPQSGTHIHKLVNIRTGDPDPLLFQVPADYTVKEESRR
jgi:hypothetical protein